MKALNKTEQTGKNKLYLVKTFLVTLQTIGKLLCKLLLCITELPAISFPAV